MSDVPGPDDPPAEQFDPDGLDEAVAWDCVKENLAHQFVIIGMGFLEHTLCPDVRYDEEIANLLSTEVFPEVQQLAQHFAYRLGARVDTLAELHLLSHPHE